MSVAGLEGSLPVVIVSLLDQYNGSKELKTIYTLLKWKRKWSLQIQAFVTTLRPYDGHKIPEGFMIT